VTKIDPRTERSRRRVLDAAIDLFVEGGVTAVTIEAVANRSGAARTTIYRQWANRDELLVDVLRSFSFALELPSADLPSDERLRLVVRQIAATMAQSRWQRALPAIFEVAQHHRELAPVVAAFHASQAMVLGTVLRDAIADETLPPDTSIPEVLLQLLGPLTMAAILPMTQPDPAMADRFVELFLTSRPPPGRRRSSRR
jgi:AcrR family transcriptional regulator